MNSYIQSTLQNSTWKPPATTTTVYTFMGDTSVLPILGDIEWEAAFATANTQQKSNIAQAWLWAFTVKTLENKLDVFGSNEEKCINHHAKWVQAIEPFLPNIFPADDPPIDRAKQKLFFKGRHGCNWINRPLWFGSPNEKLEVIAKLAANEEAIYDFTTPSQAASYDRIWETVNESYATSSDKANAAFISTQFGRHRIKLVCAEHPELLAWYEVGYAMSQIKPSSFEAVANLQKVEAFVRAQPLDIALPCFVKSTKSLMEEGYSLENLSYPFMKNRCFPIEQENIYQVLSYWFPQLEKEWSIAESIGLDFVEAAHVAISKQQSKQGSSLPDLSNITGNDW